MCTRVGKQLIYVGFTFLFQNEGADIRDKYVSLAMPKQPGPQDSKGGRH
jgi:hypothetical protein